MCENSPPQSWLKDGKARAPSRFKDVISEAVSPFAVFLALSCGTVPASGFVFLVPVLVLVLVLVLLYKSRGAGLEIGEAVIAV